MEEIKKMEEINKNFKEAKEALKVVKNVSLVFSVKDEASGLYLGPILHRNKAVALRWWTDICTKENMIKSHPNDYNLYYLGKFDEEIGLMIPEKIERFATAREFTE